MLSLNVFHLFLGLFEMTLLHKFFFFSYMLISICAFSCGGYFHYGPPSIAQPFIQGILLQSLRDSDKRFSTSCFFMNQFLPSSWTFSNFFENLRRYLQLKVQHRWQTEKIFNHKSFNYFVWTTLESRVNL
jgi:hypothetical protein